MTYLIDTNVISELRKGDRCDANMKAWYAGVGETDIFLSVLVLGEMRRGIERIRRRDPQQTIVLERWLEETALRFSGPDTARRRHDCRTLGKNILCAQRPSD